MNNQAGLSIDEKVASLFHQDTLLPTQYFDTFRRKSFLEAEKRLMLAVLEDAITCFQKCVLTRDSRGRALFSDAEEWVENQSNEWLFSFENICEALGLNAKYVRRGLVDWKQSRMANRPKAKIYRLRPHRPKRAAMAATRKTGQRRFRAVGH